MNLQKKVNNEMNFEQKMYDSIISLLLKVASKPYKLLGFIIRNSKNFHLEYSSIVWPPLYSKYSKMIEVVQRKFLKISDQQNLSNESF